MHCMGMTLMTMKGRLDEGGWLELSMKVKMLTKVQ